MWIFGQWADVTVDVDGAQYVGVEASVPSWKRVELPELAPGGHGFRVQLRREGANGALEFDSGPMTFVVGTQQAGQLQVPQITGVTFEDDGVSPEVEARCGAVEPVLPGDCARRFAAQDCFDSSHIYLRYDIEPDPARVLLLLGRGNAVDAYGAWPECPPRMEARGRGDLVCTAAHCVSMQAVGQDGNLGDPVRICDDELLGDSGTGTATGTGGTGDTDTGGTTGGDTSSGGGESGQGSDGTPEVEEGSGGSESQADSDADSTGCRLARARAAGGVDWLLMTMVAFGSVVRRGRAHALSR